MGPLADSMGISTGVAMWLAVVQLPVMMGLVLHFPTVRVDMYGTSVVVVPVNSSTSSPAVLGGSESLTLEQGIAAPNKSAIQISSYEHGLGISGVYVVAASSITFFAVLCMNLIDR
jgi:hypothetical protein